MQEMDSDAVEWVEYDQLPTIAKAKLGVLRLFTHRCIGQAGSQDSSEISTPIIEMLWTILINGGQIRPEVQEQYVPP